MTFKHLFYDWNGLNVAWFGAINHATPDWLAPLAHAGSTLGSYWSGPFLLIALLLWSWRLNAAAEPQTATLAVRTRAQRFALGLALAWLGVAVLKLIVDFPRPLVALPDTVQIIGEPQLQYSFPSGHAAYSMLIAVTLWPLAARRFRALLVAWLARALLKPRVQLEATAYCLVLGGALGNLADRVFRGYVVDSLDFHWGGWHWPAFNLADVAITCGAVLLVLASFRVRQPQRRIAIVH